MFLTASELLRIMRDTAVRQNMFTYGQTIVVGASGGPDSTALLHALTQLRDEWRLSLVACHLNHGFRGAEAEGDAEYVRALCAALNVECRIESVDVPALQKRRHLSAQQAARSARHAVLRRIAVETGAERIALAHTRDDRTETVLLNILRGSGLDGLAGFPPVAFPLIRPLYAVTRLQVEQYCRHFHLEPRHDSSNAKLNYRRNRVRTELLPQLRAYYNSKADDALLRLADLAADDNALLETFAADALNAIICPSNSSELLTLTAEKLNALPKALRRRVLRQALAQIRGDLQNVTLEAIETILEMLASGRSAILELPADNKGTVRVSYNNNALVLSRVSPVVVSVPWEYPVLVPGRTLVSGRSVLVIARTCLPDELPDTLSELRREWLLHQALNQGAVKQSAEKQNAVRQDSVPREHTPERLPNPNNIEAHTMRTDSASETVVMMPDLNNESRGQILLWPRAAVQLPLTVRSWRAGDRIRPRGLNGTKKIQDLFTDLKVPAMERSSIPLLVEEVSGRVLAAGEWRADESALLVCRLPDANFFEDINFQSFVENQQKLSAPLETRELLAILFLYQ